MNSPLDPYQAMKDESHLRLLVIFHYLLGAIELLGGIFLAIFTVFMIKMFQAIPTTAVGTAPATATPPPATASSPPSTTPTTPTTTTTEPMPEELADTFTYMMGIMYGGFALLGIILAILTLLSAYGISKKKWETLSLITAGVQCLMFPFGTVLGVFSFIVLLRPSVAAQYRANKSTTA